MSRQRHYSMEECQRRPYSPPNWPTDHHFPIQSHDHRRRSDFVTASTRRRRLLPACPGQSVNPSWSSIDYDDRMERSHRLDYDQGDQMQIRRQGSMSSPSPIQRRASYAHMPSSGPPTGQIHGEMTSRHGHVGSRRHQIDRKLSMVEHQRGFVRKYSERQLARKHSVIGECNRKYSETIYATPTRRIVDKVDRMKGMAMGDGANDCLVCGSEFGVFGSRSHATACQDCRKYVCQKTCGQEVSDGTDKRLIFVCRICNEEREAWKKSGAWFYHGVPKHVLPPRHRPLYDEEEADDQRAGSSNRHPIPTSPRRNGREMASPSPRRTLSSMPDDEPDCVPSIPSPRWANAQPDDRRRGEPAVRTGRKTVSANHHSYSSSEEEQEVCPKMSSQWRNRDEPPKKKRESSGSYSDEPSDGEGRGRNGISDHNLASHTRTPPVSGQSPSDSGAIDGSDAKSVDSGVVRGEQSPVTRPTSLLPSSPSFGQKNTQNVSASVQSVVPSMQPLTPTFRIPANVPPSQLTVGSAVAASRRASVAAVERLVEKMNVGESEATPGKFDHRFSLTCDTDMRSRPMSPDLTSSPDDEQSSLGCLEFSILFDNDNQTLTISIIRAQNLRSMDRNGFSDPFVETYLLPSTGKSTKLRTRTIHKTLNPEWHENLVYYGITDDDRLKKTLRLCVLDEDRIGADFLGETRVQLKRVTPGKEKTFSVYLERQLPVDKQDGQCENRGKILLSLKYDNDKKCLLVEIVRCAELVGMDPNGYSDPYVKIGLLPENDKRHRVKTKIKKKTLNPVFNEVFVFPIALCDLAKKTLDVTVWDHDVGKHDDYIGGVQLGIDGKGDRLKQWYDCIKNPGGTFQRWHKLTVDQVSQSSSGS